MRDIEKSRRLRAGEPFEVVENERVAVLRREPAHFAPQESNLLGARDSIDRSAFGPRARELLRDSQFASRHGLAAVRDTDDRRHEPRQERCVGELRADQQRVVGGLHRVLRILPRADPTGDADQLVPGATDQFLHGGRVFLAPESLQQGAEGVIPNGFHTSIVHSSGGSSHPIPTRGASGRPRPCCGSLE